MATHGLTRDGLERITTSTCASYSSTDDLMYKIDQIEEELANGNTEKARKAEWQKSTGLMFLHEMMHLDSVDQPHSKFTRFFLDILPSARPSRCLMVFK